MDSSGALLCEGPRAVTVGVYPALLALDAAEAEHPTVALNGTARILLPDYLVEHDLPAAYQRATGLSSTSAATRPSSSPQRSQGRVLELPVRDIRKSLVGAPIGAVRVVADVGQHADCFAVRVPTPGLASAGFTAGAWLVVRPYSSGDPLPDMWYVVTRTRGRFGATAADWTIAHVKCLSGDDGTQSRLQVSYGSATGREFRPERLESGDITLVATVVCHAVEAL